MKKVISKLVLFLIKRFDLKEEVREVLPLSPSIEITPIIKSLVVRVRSERVETSISRESNYTERFMLDVLDSMMLKEIRKQGLIQYSRRRNESNRWVYRSELNLLKIVEQDRYNNIMCEKVYDTRTKDSF